MYEYLCMFYNAVERFQRWWNLAIIIKPLEDFFTGHLACPCRYTEMTTNPCCSSVVAEH
jgi:hypothetical protein